MPITTLIPAAADPVTVTEAKDFCRYIHDDQDTLIGELVSAAVEHVQQATGRQFIPATFLLSLRYLPSDSVVRLPRSPLIAVNAVRYKDKAGTLHTLTEGTDYLVDAAATPPTVEPVKAWPVIGEFPNALQIEFEAGYEGDNDSPPDLAANVPSRAKVARKGSYGPLV